MQRAAITTGFFILALAATAAAQENEYQVVDSPFQEEFDFTINSDLEPQVEIAGVRWVRFGVHVKAGREIDYNKANHVTVELDFLNTNPEGAKVLVIALFEDANGNPLERVECAKVNANGDRLKESVQKFKISGLVLDAIRRVYIFCEVE